jgi:hypothetical protein
VSLISEALRKARQEAARREGRDRGIPHGLIVPPKRWRSGPGLALVVAIALAAAVGGAAVAWWTLGRRATTETSRTAAALPATSTPAPAVNPPATTSPTDVAAPVGLEPEAARTVPVPHAAARAPSPGTAPHR